MSEERYVRPTIGGWIRPVMFGPTLGVYTAVSLYAALGPGGGIVGRWGQWALGMAVGTLVAGIYVVVLALVDVALLALRVRVLPTGRRAWAMSAGSPLLVMLSYAVSSPFSYYRYGPWAIAAAFLAPMLVVATLVRIFGGKVPPVAAS